MTVKIKLNSVEKIQKFVSIVGQSPCNLDLVCGRSYLDAKSLLGILSCDVSRPMQLDIYGTEEESLEVVSQIEEYLIA